MVIKLLLVFFVCFFGDNTAWFSPWAFITAYAESSLRSWALNECLATKRQWGADCCGLNFGGRKITILDWAKECYIVSSRVWVWNCCQAFWFFNLHLVMRWVSLIIFILSVQRKRVQDLIPIVVLMVNQVLYFCELVQCICFVWCFFNDPGLSSLQN